MRRNLMKLVLLRNPLKKHDLHLYLSESVERELFAEVLLIS